MDGHLLRTLIDKKFFQPGVEVDAYYKGHDLSGATIVTCCGTFTLLGHRFIGESEVAMEVAAINDGSRRIVYAMSLKNIDGMDPIRFAASCGIDEKGEKIQEGKRRGRKPKNRMAEAQAVEAAFDSDDDDFEPEDNEVFDTSFDHEIFAAA